MTRSFAVAACAALALAACTTPTYYQPAGPASGRAAVGFSEYRIEPGRYRVTFQGGAGAPANQVADYALLRAAEVTLRDGYDWFRVVDRYAERSGSGGGPRVSIGTGSSSYGRRSAVGVGIGTSFDLGGGPAHAQTIEVMMGRGARPEGGDYYDARGVTASLRPRV
jgi:hypothetical protein